MDKQIDYDNEFIVKEIRKRLTELGKNTCKTCSSAEYIYNKVTETLLEHALLTEDSDDPDVYCEDCGLQLI